MPYVRPGGSTGDSLTDIGALALIRRTHGGYDCAKHIRDCQKPSGQMYRHPSTPNSDFSRDHIISLCNYTHWSKDTEPLRKFTRFTLRRFGKFCDGTIGQSMINPIVLSVCLMLLGHKLIPTLLDLLNYPVLLLEAKKQKKGYRLILVAEVGLLKMLNAKWKWPWKFLLEQVYKREPNNLFYAVIAGKTDATSAVVYKNNYPKERIGGQWHWNSVETPPRKATGIDLEYLICLANYLEKET